MITSAELFETYEPDLRRYALRLSGDPDEADDLVSETFYRAYLHLELLGRLNPPQRKAWLYRVLKNRFLDGLRARQREQSLAAQMAWAENLAAFSLYDQEITSQIPARYLKLFQMRFALQMTSEEIGEKLGLPAATVRSRLRLALQWLRAHQTDFIR